MKKRLLSMILSCSIIMSSMYGIQVSVNSAKKMSLYIKQTAYTRTIETSKDKKKQTIQVKNISGKDKVVWKTSNRKICALKTGKNGKATLTTILGKAGTAKITATVKNKKTNKIIKVFSKKIAIVNKKNPTPSLPPVNSGQPSTPPTMLPSQAPSTQPSISPSVQPSVSPSVSPSPSPTQSILPTVSPSPTPVDPNAEPKAPTFSKMSGEYESAFQLTLTSDTGSTIYYTMDGSVPNVTGNTPSTTKYENGISIQNRNGLANLLATFENQLLMNHQDSYVISDDQVPKITVIRAMAVSANGKKSKVITKTYLVGDNSSLLNYNNIPVISLVTDPNNLLDPETGIYVTGNHINYKQKGREWEREAHIEYFNNNGTSRSTGFASDIGIRIHGGYTRNYAQKSLNIYFREEYGLKNLKYELLPGATKANGKKTDKYKNFMLRNGGNDCEYTKIGDAFNQSLVSNRNMATQATRPCIVYLNGEYWGYYNIQEKYGDNYLEEKFGVNKDNVMMIKNGQLDEGIESDMEFYNEFKAFAYVTMNDTNYSAFCENVDIQNYIDYYAAQIYIANNDWPHNNYCLWRCRDKEDSTYGDTKWRYLLFDTEYSLNLYNHAPYWADSVQWAQQKNSLFANLMTNDTFKKQFANTMMDLYNDNFDLDESLAKLDQMVDVYRPLHANYVKRFGNGWGGGASLASFDDRISKMKEFLTGRRESILDIMAENFSTGKVCEVTLSGEKGYGVIVNTLNNPSRSKYVYFTNYPITVKAPDVSGKTFERWEVSGGTATSTSEKETIVTLNSENATVQAVYK